MTLIWNIVEKSMEMFFEGFDLIDGLNEIMIVIHKSPIVFKECMRPIADIEYLDTLFLDSFDLRNYNFWIHIIENVLFNSGDIYQNIITS